MDAIVKNTKAMIEAAVDAQMPVMLVGSPGTGKTVTVKEMARERGYDLITLVGSRMDPTDVVGLPKGEPMGEDEDGKTIYGTVNLSPWWQVEILTKKKVILFLDEWSNSPAAIQAAFLTLLQDREFANGHKFPAETIIIGASNPVDEAADGVSMSLPTSNRIFWIAWNPPTSAWVEGMRNAFGKTVSEEEMKWKHKIASFIKEQPGYLHILPDESAQPEAYEISGTDASAMEVFRSAWPSRRSWDNLSRVLAVAPDTTSVQDGIAAGIVGQAATIAFREWLRKHDTIDPSQVLADPNSVDWKNISVNDANLLFRALMDMATPDNAVDVIEVFIALAEAERAALGAPFVQDLIRVSGDRKASAEVYAKNRDANVRLWTAYRTVAEQAVKKDAKAKA